MHFPVNVGQERDGGTMQRESDHPPVGRRNGGRPSENDHGGTPGLVAVVNAVLVGVPAAYAACHSVLITLVTAAVAFGIVLIWRRIQ
jgi:hypothetical protein